MPTQSKLCQSSRRVIGIVRTVLLGRSAIHRCVFIEREGGESGEPKWFCAHLLPELEGRVEKGSRVSFIVLGNKFEHLKKALEATEVKILDSKQTAKMKKGEKEPAHSIPIQDDYTGSLQHSGFHGILINFIHDQKQDGKPRSVAFAKRTSCPKYHSTEFGTTVVFKLGKELPSISTQDTTVYAAL
jgi:hypothetical protein